MTDNLPAVGPVTFASMDLRFGNACDAGDLTLIPH